MKKKMLFALALLCSGLGANAQRTMTIDELFGLIEENNSQMNTSRMGIEAAKHGVEAAKAQRLPDVEVTLQGSLNGDVLMMDRDFTNSESFASPRWGNSFVVEAQQPIYTGGAITAGIRLAELGKQMEETNLTATRNGLRFASLAKYLEIIKMDNALRVYEENILLTNRLIENIGAMQKQGMAMKNDLTRYELQLQDLQLGKRKVEDARNIVNHQLCITLGIDEEKIMPDVAIANADYAQEGEQYWHDHSLVESPDMARTEIGAKMAEQQLKIAKSDYLPKVAVVVTDNFTGPFTYDLPPVDKNLNIWFVGVGLKYSLGNLWKSNRKVSQAKIQLQQSNENRRVVAEAMDSRMQEAYTLYMQSYAELETMQKSVQLATQNYNVVNNRYLNQLALVTDMLDASNMKLNAELREVDARVNIALAYYKLKFIAGKL